MYSFLREVLRIKGITIIELAKMIGISEKSMRNKLNGVTEFTWSEAKAIRAIVAPGMSLDELFIKDEDRKLALSC